MSSLIVGVDRSSSSRRAVAFAARLAAESGATLVVVHVIPWSPYSFTTPAENEHRSASKASEVAAAQQQIIDPAVAVTDEYSVTPTTSVIHGSPAEKLCSLAAGLENAHIVVGRTGDSKLKQVLFGSTPSKLIQIATTPVTVIP
ncbi:universal stress protein [Marisediminicola senii]|uniref:universal stress protein n=1 Tax=Marisediminicola senii TaxID=2711233 RepID=UPI0013EBF596|nr:universal stress protein [Marisediminicola senii]